MRSLFFSSFILLFTISCNFSNELEDSSSWENIKSIETSFISHQGDTQEKNNRIVAIAHFNPDGSFSHATQHTSYPYTHLKNEELDFWDTPRTEMLWHIMDGLSLGDAEKNLLYGNDWPKVYADLVQKEGHPKFPVQGELFIQTSQITAGSNSLPDRIETGQQHTDQNESFPELDEVFDYDKGRVTMYGFKYLYEFEMIRQRLEEDQDLGTDERENMENFLKERDIYEKTHFHYDKDDLTQVSKGDNRYQFYYKDGMMERSEFYIGNELMHQRTYYYLENGLKDRTVIFNTYNEPEYTIQYSYHFYQPDKS